MYINKTEVQIYIAEHYKEMSLRQMAKSLHLSIPLLCRWADDMGYLEKVRKNPEPKEKRKRKKRNRKKCAKCTADLSAIIARPIKKTRGRPKQNPEDQIKPKRKAIEWPQVLGRGGISEVKKVPAEYFNAHGFFNVDSEENWIA